MGTVAAVFGWPTVQARERLVFSKNSVTAQAQLAIQKPHSATGPMGL
jgi:hypothetical protein